MIKNIIIVLIFVITNLLEVALLKPFFFNFLFLNIPVIVVFATNKNFYTKALFLAFIYGILLNILFASNIFLLPLILVTTVFILNNLSLWFGEKLFHKLIYVFVCIATLRIFVGQSEISTILSTEILFALIYTVVLNNIFQFIKNYVDF